MSSSKQTRGASSGAHRSNGYGSRPHARGSIVRLKLQNFLTFDGVEIEPSSQLNVIVGPNGTGKSSIVCAICIGLGGSTKLLGRAKDIKEFVKHGKKEGSVELELCETRKGCRNPIIKRRITADDNSSVWYLNGRMSKLADVTKLVEEMNIQLHNKCVFLPQDMVVEFARMNMYQRLEETEQAIGPRGMFENHTELKGLRSTHSTEESDLKVQRNSLKAEETKNQLLERDVERFQNRQEYITTIKWIGLKKLWLEYEDARTDMNTKKSQRREASNALKAIKQKYQPIKDKLKVQEDAVKEFKQAEIKVNQTRRVLLRTVSAYQEKLASLEDKLEEPRQELEQAKKDEANRKKKIEEFRREIEGFRQELAALEPQESILPKIHAKNAQMATIKQDIDDIIYQLREMGIERDKYNDTIRRNEDELRQMQDVRSQRLQMLQRADHWTYDALMWLSDNQHRFKQPILEPVMVSVNVKDPRYTSQVEGFLGGKDFLSFVAQNEEDKEVFLREVRDSMRLKVNVVRAPNKRLHEYTPKIPYDVLRRFGFEKVMMDLIEAPEPLLCYFCEYQGLHQVPIAGDLSPAQVQKITDNLSSLRLFFAGSSRYSVTRSLYRNATSTRVGDLREPRFLVASVDMTRKAALEQEIQETMRCRAELDRNYTTLKKKDDALRQDSHKLLQEKNALKKVTDQRRAFNGNINSRETKLANLNSSSFNLQEAEEQCEKSVERIQRERVSCFSDIKSNLKKAVDVTSQSVEASLRVTTTELRVNFLLQQYHDVKSTYDNAEEELKTLELAERRAKEKAQVMLQRARAKSGVASPADNTELMHNFQLLPNNLDELLDRMHSLQAQADMCQGTDQSVVEEFEKRKKEIEKLRKRIEHMERDLSNRDKKIADLKNSWLIPLKDLVSGVSDRFRKFFSNHTQMEAAGEVCLVESEDFSKYGIDIKVKFRDSEQLQALNAQRQSGGERSVSTMLYLMALQGSSSCPFRVVDEINQGMDPVNERHVFNLIVKSAAEGAQYFLLTPKLLQNLEYSEAVQVHIVNNGQEAMNYKEWNLQSILS